MMKAITLSRDLFAKDHNNNKGRELEPTADATTTNHQVKDNELQNSSPFSMVANQQTRRISFHLKTGIFIKRVTIDADKKEFTSIKQLAISFLNEIYFQNKYPANTYIGKNLPTNESIQLLFNKLVLTKYDPKQDQFIKLDSIDDIEPECLVSVDVSGDYFGQQRALATHLLASTNKSNMSHLFRQESYYLPTDCDTCKTLIKGIFKQGFQCTYCKKNFCPKCKVNAEQSSLTCPQATLALGSNMRDTSISDASPLSSPKSKATSGSQQSSKSQVVANANKSTSSNSNISLKKSTDNLPGSSKDAANEKPPNLHDSPKTQQPADSKEQNKREPVVSSGSNVSRDANIRLHRLAPSIKHVKRPDSTKPIIEGWLKHTTLADEQARRHYWRLDDKDITLYENNTSTRYFKAIALSKITRVMSAHNLPKTVKWSVLTTSDAGPQQNQQPQNVSTSQQQQPPLELNVTDGLKSSTQEQQTTRPASASSAKSPELQAQMRAMFAFELTSGSMYLVQASSESEATSWKEALANITGKSGVAAAKSPPPVASGEPLTGIAKLIDSVSTYLDSKPLLVKRQLEQDKQDDSGQKLPSPEAPAAEAKQLSEQQAATTVKQPPAQRAFQYPAVLTKSRLNRNLRKTITLDSMFIPDHLIEGKYLVERNKGKQGGFVELGSGQFGKVYAAIAEFSRVDQEKGLWSGIPVAIKEISKKRFDLHQQAKLKNEADILFKLDHPGVIILERVHDTPEKIYIVMEQLEDDMLEMIISTEEKRLSERVTKFLTFQILEALKYLHGKHIAHCDLKPENVLLVESRSQFPQIKLCDFGFAKIIEDNSFRCSLVGTPAYLAPEVVKGEGYNRSVDLWSVGVIVYVSLSGEFPFNEGETIPSQISRANFLFPEQPWSKISNGAKNFINSLLKVNRDKRLIAFKAQMDDWFQDYQLWCDLSELEVRVGRRWVTDKADYERWTRHAREHKLQIPRSAIILQEDLSD